MKKILLIITLLSAVVFANPKINYRTANLYKADISSTTAYEMQKNGVILIDIRTKNEFKTLRAKDSINIPIFKEENKQRVFNKQFLQEIYSALKSDVNKKVILICRSGSRTKLASNLLASEGFTNVYNVTNGFQYDWLKVKLPTEK